MSSLFFVPIGLSLLGWSWAYSCPAASVLCDVIGVLLEGEPVAPGFGGREASGLGDDVPASLYATHHLCPEEQSLLGATLVFAIRFHDYLYYHVSGDLSRAFGLAFKE